MADPLDELKQRYRDEVKRIPAFEGSRDIAAAQRFIDDVESIRFEYDELFDVSWITMKKLPLGLMRGEARIWMGAQSLDDFTAFKSDFIGRFSETPDELWRRFRGMTYCRHENVHEYGARYELLAHTLGIPAGPYLVYMFVDSIEDQHLKVEVRIRSPNSIKDAIRVMHTIVMAGSDDIPVQANPHEPRCVDRRLSSPANL